MLEEPTAATEVGNSIVSPRSLLPLLPSTLIAGCLSESAELAGGSPTGLLRASVLRSQRPAAVMARQGVC